jgi:hypothetical protein
MEHTPATPQEQAPETQAIGETDVLHIRQVEDRGLPATAVLPELSEDRGPRGPVPVFVP